MLYKLFLNPIFRKIIASVIMLIIGVFIGYSFKEKQLKKAHKNKHYAEAKYTELKEHFSKLEITNDTLLKVIIALAKTEKISIKNNISGTKLKDGSSLDFTPKTEAILNTLKTKNVQKNIQPEMKEAPVKNTKNTSDFEVKNNLFNRIFRRRKLTN